MKRNDGLLDIDHVGDKVKISDGDRTYLIDEEKVGKVGDYLEAWEKIRSLYFNKRVFRYPGGYRKEQLCNEYRFRALFAKGENPLKNPYMPEEEKPDVDYWNGEPGETRKHNVYRAKRKVEDIVLLNENLGWWVTLTFNDEKADASDLQKVKQKSRYWLQNNVSRKDLAFVLVPEYHPRSKDRVHFHGLFNDSLEMVDSGTRTVDGFDKPLKLETIRRLHVEDQVRDVVYNIKDWRLGFSTAIKVTGTRSQLAAYLTKYMTKDECAAAEKIFGKRYWTSKNVERTPPIELVDAGWGEFASHDVQTYGYGVVRYIYIDHTGDKLE